MNLRQLGYFVRVVEAGNMSHAADQLHVAQTALSMQIRQLEEELGVALLIRHSRGVEPTRAGKLLHEQALEILKLVEQTRKVVAESEREESEVVRLGITPGLAMIIGTHISLNVHEQMPHVFFTLVEGPTNRLVELLTHGDVDLILCFDVPDLPQLSRTALLQDDLVFVTLPGPSKGQPIAFVDVLGEVLAAGIRGSTIVGAAARTAQELGLEFKITYEVGSIPAQKDLVSRGAATSILPYFSVINEVRAGSLDARPIVMPELKRTLFLASLKQRGQFKNEAALNDVIGSALTVLLEALGPLGHPLSASSA